MDLKQIFDEINRSEQENGFNAVTIDFSCVYNDGNVKQLSEMPTQILNTNIEMRYGVHPFAEASFTFPPILHSRFQLSESILTAYGVAQNQFMEKIIAQESTPTPVLTTLVTPSHQMAKWQLKLTAPIFWVVEDGPEQSRIRLLYELDLVEAYETQCDLHAIEASVIREMQLRDEQEAEIMKTYYEGIAKREEDARKWRG